MTEVLVARATGAVQRFMEAQNRSNFLLLRKRDRKTASQFSWNCSEAKYEHQRMRLATNLTADRYQRPS
jgi:hypothetical protein